jgi:hypothetical protein
MAKVALASGDAAEAERLLDEATSVLRDCPWFLALVLYRRAVLAVRRGNADEAIALVRDSLALFRPLHDKYAILYVMVPLAAAAELKARTCGRRGFSALGTHHRTHRRHHRRHGCRPLARGGTEGARASARIDGPGRMPQARDLD